MNFKKIFFILTILILFLSPKIPSYSLVNEDLSMKVINNVDKNGFLGYYFSDKDYTDLQLIAPNITSQIAAPLNKFDFNIESAKLFSVLKPSISGNYLITSSHPNTTIYIDGKVLDSQKTISLSKNREYNFTIEYNGDFNDSDELEIFWEAESFSKTQIPYENLKLPNFSLSGVNNLSNTLYSSQRNGASKLADTDKDTIPDEWEINGYTVDKNSIIQWNNHLSPTYKKYVSNPDKKNSSNDPYTDLEKVLGHLPISTRIEARDPLVAAYPVVSVTMEKLLYAITEDVTEGQSGTKAKSTTNSKTKTRESNLNVSISSIGVGTLIGGDYTTTQSDSNTVEITDSSETEWSKEISGDPSEAAYLNANIRYNNYGTAPIYNTQPTTNFVLKNKLGSDTLATIKANKSIMANALRPDSTFPEKGTSAIALDKINDSGLTSIAIDQETLDAIQSKESVINLETIQTNGLYGIINPQTGKLEVNSNNEWAHIQSEVDASSATIILDLGNNKVLERKITTKNPSDHQDRTPKLTIREAIKKAFDAHEIDNRLFYKDDELIGSFVEIEEQTLAIFMDNRTKENIDLQLKSMNSKKIYDATLEKGMHITLRVPEYLDDFLTKENWVGIKDYVDFDKNAVGVISEKAIGKIPSNILTEYNDYLLSLRVYSPKESNTISTGFGFGKEERSDLRVKSVNIPQDEWVTLKIPFTATSEMTKKDVSFFIKTNDFTKVYIDDLMITSANQDKSIKKEHSIKSWVYGKGYILTLLTFNSVPDKTNLSYHLEIDGISKGISTKMDIDSKGQYFLDLTKLNGDTPLYRIGDIRVFAKEDGETTQTQIARFNLNAGNEELVNKLSPESMIYFYKPSSKGYCFQVKSKKQAPGSLMYTLIDLDNIKAYPMWPISPGESSWVDKITINPDSQYVLFMKYDGKLYHTSKFYGREVPIIK